MGDRQQLLQLVLQCSFRVPARVLGPRDGWRFRTASMPGAGFRVARGLLPSERSACTNTHADPPDARADASADACSNATADASADACSYAKTYAISDSGPDTNPNSPDARADARADASLLFRCRRLLPAERNM
jgi:hypothetical protein